MLLFCIPEVEDVVGGLSATSTSMPEVTICSAGSVLRFSIAAVTLELESADVPEAGEKVSSFSVPPVPEPPTVVFPPSFDAAVAHDAAAVMVDFNEICIASGTLIQGSPLTATPRLLRHFWRTPNLVTITTYKYLI